jgi:hypothetical protein
MTTSLPTASPELPLAGTPAGTAANPGSLLDLLAAAQPGQPGQPGAVTATAGGVPPESFATLLAPASTPVVPAPAAPLATAHATTHATSARALRLPVVTETVPEAATPVLPAPEGDNPAAPLDRSTL